MVGFFTNGGHKHFYVCQQEEEQALVNVLEENVDKMQLTRRILDLKQVGLKTLQTLNNLQEVKVYTFPSVFGLYYNFVEVSQSLIYD